MSKAVDASRARGYSWQTTPLEGVLTLARTRHLDERGSFERLLCVEGLSDILGERRIVQVNRSITRDRGTVRGMHLQKGSAAEMKIIACTSGAVYDVAVDLRPGSSTYLQWHAEILRADEAKSLVIPEGFAHGFQVLEGDAELIYLHTQFYDPSAEDGMHPLDPAAGISWPLEVVNLSAKDKKRGFYVS